VKYLKSKVIISNQTTATDNPAFNKEDSDSDHIYEEVDEAVAAALQDRPRRNYVSKVDGVSGVNVPPANDYDYASRVDATYQYDRVDGGLHYDDARNLRDSVEQDEVILKPQYLDVLPN
jgi:hypothetical protein